MEESLITRLLSESGVTSLAGARIYPGSVPQASAMPAATVQRISGRPVYSSDGEEGLGSARIQVDCWGDTYGAAKTLARAVIAALSAFHGTVGSTTFQLIELEAERDLRESGSNQAEYRFRTSLDFICWAER